jgi:exopolysaccharide biosynthesis polyprenyl glycosylphosphotransferase
LIRLFKVSVPGSVVTLLVSEVTLLFCCYLAAVYFIVEDPQFYLFYENRIYGLSLIVLTVIVGLYFGDMYEDYRIPSRIALVQQFCMVIGVAFLVQAICNYGRWTPLLMNKWAMVYGSGLALVAGPAWRILFATLMSRAVRPRKLLFLGSSPVVGEVIGQLFESPQFGLAPIGFLDNDASAPPKLAGSPRLGAISDLGKVVTANRPDSIIVGMAERRGNLPVEELLHLRLSGIHVEDAALIYQNVFRRVSTRDLRPSELIFSAELGPQPQKIALQSAYSFLIALVALAVLTPLIVIIAVIVKLTSPGPAFYRQTRVGFNGEHFTLYKFRSMSANAEEQTGPAWATKDDPRITPVGRWLRKLRIDELPQLFNVLRGEMSIVGPRPERPEFVAVLEEKIPYYRLRHSVKPGITGWAQINHKYGDTIEDTIIKLEFDLYYIKNMAFSLDAFIIFHTAKTMLLARGSQ